MTTTIGVSLKAYLDYPDTLQWAASVAQVCHDRTKALEVFVLPSFPALTAVRHLVEPAGVQVGGQDIAVLDAGNQTGEVTGAMLASAGCRYAEVGHAERRRNFGDTDDVVAAKTAAARRHGLVPVLCVGEATAMSAADATAESIRQLRHVLGASAASRDRIVVAYEPHWAIGSSEPASDEHIVAVATGLRTAVDDLTDGSAVVYGGSAGPGLLPRLRGGVDGLFLGRLAHDPAALAAVLDEALTLTRETVVTP